jgi:hypothetical protein
VEVGAERTRVILELGSGEPVEGFLVADDGPPRAFSGWMELVAVLQSVLDEAALSDGCVGRLAGRVVEGGS